MAKRASTKAIERARASAAAARRKARESRDVLEKKAFLAGGAYGLGMAQRSGLLDKLPGPNKHLMAAIGAGVAGMFVKGTAGRALDSVSDAALAVYMHGLATGARVAGVGAAPQLSAAEIERRLEAAIDRIEGLDDDEDEVGIDDEDEVGIDEDEVGIDDDEIGIDDDEEVVEGVLVGAEDLID